jgi:hypothetical protein
MRELRQVWNRRSDTDWLAKVAGTLCLALALFAVTSVGAGRPEFTLPSGAQEPTPPTPTLTQLAPNVIVFRQGIDGYQGCADTRISEHRPNENFGDDELILGDRGRIHTLIRFDVSSLPVGAFVEEASLGLYVHNYGQRRGPIIAAAYTVLRTWEEMEATWFKATDMDYWGVPGCNDTSSDRSPTPLDQQTIYERDRWHIWDVTTAVRGWVGDPATNKGVIVQQTNTEVGGEFDIRSSEYPGRDQRPYLMIRYSLQTPTPTHTSTATPTSTATNTPTVTPTRTSTATPVPTPVRLYLPKMLKGYPIWVCEEWGYTFREEFEDPALTGWSVSRAGGQEKVSDSVIRLWTQPSTDRFPLVWRNDLFTGAALDFQFEARFRHSDFTAYGTTIGLNSASFDGKRFPAGQSLPAGIEDILTIHHVVDVDASVYRFDISLLRGRVVWVGTPGDTNWHKVRITRDSDNRYTLYVDDQRVGSAKSTLRPRSVYLGNPTIQPFVGGWTQLHVDYIRVSRCLVWGYD